jgi:phage terminase large subunit
MVETHLVRPGFRALCGREVQKSLKDSAKRLIEDKIQALGLGNRFEVLRDEIRSDTGGTINFIGLADHTAESIKSFEGADVCWVEEAQTITQRSLGLLDPTIRKPGSQLWLSWNPRRPQDAVEKLPWGDPRWARLVKANYHDNPFLDDNMIALAEKSKDIDLDTYTHVWLGSYESMGSKVVIPAAWVQSAIGLAQRLDLPIEGKLYSALDVAGAEEGGDENAQAIRKGVELQFLDKWNGLDTALTTHKAVRNMARYHVTEGYYDSVGVGEGVTGEWASMQRRGEAPRRTDMIAWSGGASPLDPDKRIDPLNPHSPLNKDQYHNLKAQAWFAMRKRFENAHKAATGREYDKDMLISLPADLPLLNQLTEELSQPQQKPSATGKVMVDKQPDGAKSPNLADSVVMAFHPARAATYTLDNLD